MPKSEAKEEREWTSFVIGGCIGLLIGITGNYFIDTDRMKTLQSQNTNLQEEIDSLYLVLDGLEDRYEEEEEFDPFELQARIDSLFDE
tara:strand:+ start:76 stop:339 length:264 start_codon:yes stop_codon:yes gene_type:complete